MVVDDDFVEIETEIIGSEIIGTEIIEADVITDVETTVIETEIISTPGNQIVTGNVISTEVVSTEVINGNVVEEQIGEIVSEVIVGNLVEVIDASGVTVVEIEVLPSQLAMCNAAIHRVCTGVPNLDFVVEPMNGCKSYVQCFQGCVLQRIECIGDDFYYDPILGDCNWGELSGAVCLV